MLVKKEIVHLAQINNTTHWDIYGIGSSLMFRLHTFIILSLYPFPPGNDLV